MSVSNPVAILYDINGNAFGVPTNPIAVQTSGSVGITGAITIAGGSIQSGSTASGFPSLVAGADSSGILRGLLTDASGKLFITAPQGISVYTQGTQAVSGTVAITTAGLSIYTQGAQAVTGSVSVYTQGAQQVSGSVSVLGGISVFTQGAQLVSGTISVGGQAQSGSTAVGNPVFAAGADANGIIRGLLTDSSGKLFVSGSVAIANAVTATVSGNIASGSASTTNPIVVAGVDGGNLVRALSTDFNGRLNVNATVTPSGTTTVIGLAVSGSTAQGAPVFIGGADSGGIARGLLTDTLGRQTVVGPVLSGSTATNSAPVLIGGIDALGVVRTLKTDASGRLVSEASATTSVVTSVASSASNVTLLATNTAREGATIFNDSTQVLYVKLGITASNTSYTVQLTARGYYEVPFGYLGQIDAIWANANGNARITELS